MNFYKPLFFISLGGLITFFCLWYFHHCPECPPLSNTHTVDTVYRTIETAGDSASIKLTKSVKPHDTYNVRTSYVNHTYEKQFIADEINLCDSIKTEFEARNTFELAHKDSVSEGTITVNVEKNKIIGFKTDFTYSLLQVHDSIFIHDPPKKCFTLGLFAGRSSGAAIGYRWTDKQASVGYDVFNKGIVFGFNLDLK